MSQLAKQLFSAVKDLSQGVIDKAKETANDMYSDITKEVYRQGSFGAQELASALFGGNAFVLYGGRDSSNEHQKTQEHEQEHEREGMER